MGLFVETVVNLDGSFVKLIDAGDLVDPIYVCKVAELGFSVVQENDIVELLISVGEVILVGVVLFSVLDIKKTVSVAVILINVAAASVDVDCPVVVLFMCDAVVASGEFVVGVILKVFKILSVKAVLVFANPAENEGLVVNLDSFEISAVCIVKLTFPGVVVVTIFDLFGVQGVVVKAVVFRNENEPENEDIFGDLAGVETLVLVDNAKFETEDICAPTVRKLPVLLEMKIDDKPDFDGGMVVVGGISVDTLR